MVNAIDATAMAIFMFEGANLHSPTVRNIRNNNPGNLRPLSDLDTTDGQGYRTFPFFSLGWSALVSDISYKVHHHVQAGTLLDLFELYAPGADHNNPNGYAQFVCKWLSDALDQTITLTTPIASIYH
jgi:hypothetical protein